MGNGIAYQIRSTRSAREWSQDQLAEAAGMQQGNISRLESPDYGKATISSLKRIADAFDVALVVRFVPFSQYIDWLSGTIHVDNGLSPETMAVPSFDDEEKGVMQSNETVYATNVPFYGSFANVPVNQIFAMYQPYGASQTFFIPTAQIETPTVETRVA